MRQDRAGQDHGDRWTLASLMSLHPKKLLGSKWTACHPREKEKHFLAVRTLPVDGPVKTVVLEAVLTGSEYEIPWRELRDVETWKAGWQ